MKKYIFLILISLLSLLLAILESFIRSFRIDYLVFFAAAALYFSMGIVLEKGCGNKLKSFLFCAPALAILIYGVFANPTHPYQFYIEATIIFSSFALGLNLKHFVSPQKVLYPMLWFSSIACFSFLINPKIHFRMSAKSEDALKSKGVSGGCYFIDTGKNTVDLDSFKSKILLIEFQFIACPACIQKNGSFEQLYNKYRNDSNVVIFSVYAGAIDSFEDYRKRVSTLHTEINQLYDPESRFCKRNNIQSFPTEIIINNGFIVGFKVGFNKDLELVYVSETSKILENLKKKLYEMHPLF
ncbi:MAG: hypothetical protein ABIX01_12295 [Chitinophagaceae bacterium]